MRGKHLPCFCVVQPCWGARADSSFQGGVIQTQPRSVQTTSVSERSLLCGFERIAMQSLQPMQPEPDPAFTTSPAHAAGWLLFDPVVLGTISPCSAAACWSARFPVRECCST